MAKQYGNFTANAGKALKGVDRLFCRTDDDGMIYICTGYYVYRMNKAEYAATIQPMTKCDAGNWNIERGEKREAGPADFDVVKVFRDNVAKLDGKAPHDITLTRCPVTFQVESGEMCGYYNPVVGFAAFYNVLYMSAFAPDLVIYSNGTTTPAFLFRGEEPVGLVLPVRAKANAARAVKAYFTEVQPAEAPAAELEALRAELDKLRSELETEREYSAAKRAENEELYTRLAEQESKPAPEAAPALAEDLRSAAELIAARFAGLEGVETTIRGAQTAAPVVWLAGEVKRHADAIRAAGAKWSSKKSAYYVRVA